LPPETAQLWAYVMNEVYLKRRGADESAKRRVLFEMRRAAVAAMDAAGVRLLAGTDPQTPGVLPGFGLHQELELMVGAGLTPLRALQTATVEPARFLGRESWSGTVEPGKGRRPADPGRGPAGGHRQHHRSEEHTSELQSRENLV